MIGQRCRWFALCTNRATRTRSHPILGAVPICAHCDDKTAAIEGAVRRNPIAKAVTRIAPQRIDSGKNYSRKIKHKGNAEHD